MSKKIGLATVTALVIGSQVGAGVFLLPSSLAAYGTLALLGWVFSAIGAILLALIFGKLCMHIPKAGGPHVYVNAAFGAKAAFFTGWAYWIISWTTNIAVIVAAIGYLTPILGRTSKLTNLGLEIFFFSLLTGINLRGTAFAGIVEVVLTILKCIPLIIIPCAGLFFFNIENFYPINPNNLPVTSVIAQSSLLTFWAFVGLESATANANVIKNPEKTVPLAVIYGTISVALLYALNSIGIMGVVPNKELALSNAPYVDATTNIFGPGWDVIIGIVAFLACIGTLNAWILTSGQIAYGAAKDKLFPAFFGKTNNFGAPSNSILIAFIGTIPLLIMTTSDNLVQQVTMITDAGVTGFLIIYVVCMIAFIKMYYKIHRIYSIIAFLAMGFCLWVILSSGTLNIMLCLLIVISGIPIYILQLRKHSL